MSGILFLISGPSGVGKSSIVRAINESEFKSTAIVSYTTRPMREGETDGKDYHFVSPEIFFSMTKQQKFVSTVKIFDHHYGAKIEDFMGKLLENNVIFDVDCVVAREYRRQFPKKCISIFIQPPNYEILVNRLIKRGDPRDSIDRRLAASGEMMKFCCEYDYLVTNEEGALLDCVGKIQSIIQAERHRIPMLAKVVLDGLNEYTFCIIKPEAVRDRLVSQINFDIESKGLSISAMKMITLDRTRADQFYQQFKSRSYYEDFLTYMTSGPIIVQILSGPKACSAFLKLKGETEPHKCEPGTLRAKYGRSAKENAVHGSDDISAARNEISFFFSSGELLELGIASFLTQSAACSALRENSIFTI